MVAVLADYPFKKARDLRSAMAGALARYMAELTFTFPATKTPTKLAAVYEEWATFETRAIIPGGPLPAAVVLPDKALADDDAFTPRILEETWTGAPLNDDGSQVVEGGIGDGSGDGFALWVVAEKVVPFLVVARAKSRPQRQAIVSMMEDAFIRAGDADGPRTPTYGIVLTMPDYYERAVRFTFESHELLTSESSAKENRWLVQFALTAEAKQCVVRRAVAMDARVQLVVDGT